MQFGSVYTSSPLETNNNNVVLKQQIVPKWCKLDDSAAGPTPRPRHGHRAVAIKELMLVFGGGNEGIVDELHLYDTTANQWYVPDLRGTKPRGYAAYGMVANQSKVFIFGGMVEFGRYSNDLFELQIKRWEWHQLRVRPPTDGQRGPCPRLGHTFTLGLNNIAYVFGGLANDSDDPKFNVPKYLNDFYAIDLSGAPNGLWWCCPQTNGQLPSARESHTTVHFTTQTGKEQLIIYGGMNGTRLGDVWILDLLSMNWSNPVPGGVEPLPRSLHTANVIGCRMFIFGGWVPARPEDKMEQPDKEWKCTNTLAVLNLNTLRWEHPIGPHALTFPSNPAGTPWPVPRAGHSAAVINKRIYIWSGRDGYRKLWNSQVCCKDMVFLETECPAIPSGIQLVKASVNSLEISWTPSPTADRYILQIQRAEHQPESEKAGRRSGVRLLAHNQHHPFGGGPQTLQRAASPVIGGSSPVRAVRPATAASYRRYGQQQLQSQQQMHFSPPMMHVRPLRIKSVASCPRSTQPIVQQQRRSVMHMNRSDPVAVVSSSPISSHQPLVHQQQTSSSPRAVILHKAPLLSSAMVSSDSEGSAITSSSSLSTALRSPAAQHCAPKRIYVHTSQSSTTTDDALPATGIRLMKQFPNGPLRAARQTSSSQVMATTPNTFDILPPPAKMVKHMDFAPTVSDIVPSSETTLSSTTTKTTYAAPVAPSAIDQTMPHNILDEALNEAENFVDEQQQQFIQHQQPYNTDDIKKEEEFDVLLPTNGGGGDDDGQEEEEAVPAQQQQPIGEASVGEENEKEEGEKKEVGKWHVAETATIKLVADNNNLLANEGGEKTAADEECEEFGVEQMRATDPSSERDSLKEAAAEQQQAAQLFQPIERDVDEHDEQQSLTVKQYLMMRSRNPARTESVSEPPLYHPHLIGVVGGRQQQTASVPPSAFDEQIMEKGGELQQHDDQPASNMQPKQDDHFGNQQQQLESSSSYEEFQHHQQLPPMMMTTTPMRKYQQQQHQSQLENVTRNSQHQQQMEEEEIGIGGRIVPFGEQQLLPVSVLESRRRPIVAVERFGADQRRMVSSSSEFVAQHSSADSGNKWFHVADLPSSTQRFVISQYSATAVDGGTGGRRTATMRQTTDDRMVEGASAQFPNDDDQQQQEVGDEQQSSAASNERHGIIALEPGTVYKIRCRAANSVGHSGWSQIASFKTCLPGFPGAPSNIKITKCPEGAYISWEPPLLSNGQIGEYSVHLAMRAQQHQHMHTQQPVPASFVRVYVGPTANCVIKHAVLGLAHIDTDNAPKPAIIFRIAARNEKGYGPVTQVRWLQESRALVPVAVMPPCTLQPLPE
uniref:Fibronectin type-III domain-containing protein n=1 Tax=Globodera rostochiensis TaxID=31243 RepID=A0A914H9Y6_GLORO